MFELRLTPEARQAYSLLKHNSSQSKRYTAVKKTLKLLAMNPRHNSLQTHEYESLTGLNGEKVLKRMQNRKRRPLTGSFGIMDRHKEQSPPSQLLLIPKLIFSYPFSPSVKGLPRPDCRGARNDRIF